MADAPEGTAGYPLFEAIAEALRTELGPEIEQQPGGPDNSNSGQVNRAFRIVIRILLGAELPPEHDLAAAVSRVLDQLARRRLAACGLSAQEIDNLIARAGPGRDDWLAYFVLTDADEIALLFQGDPDTDSPV